MTREIKFRAWDKKEMVYISDIHTLEFEKKGRWFVMEQCKGLFCNHLTGVLMQYTELRDKNGKEIYQNDLCTWGGSGVWEIEWDNRNAMFVFREARNIDRKWLISMMTDEEFSTIEVIGNIYENPNLL